VIENACEKTYLFIYFSGKRFTKKKMYLQMRKPISKIENLFPNHKTDFKKQKPFSKLENYLCDLRFWKHTPPLSPYIHH